MKRFDGTEIPQAEAERFRAFVDGHKWTFAKTYAAFCPHEYTLRRECSRDYEFQAFAEFIWKNGFNARYGKNEGRYFIDSETGWYYFLPLSDYDEIADRVKDEIGLINRASLCQFEFVPESTLLEDVWRVKRLPPEMRKDPYESISKN